MATREETLNLGAFFKGTDAQKLAWVEAYYAAIWGSDTYDGGIGTGTFFRRRAVVMTGQAVSANAHTPELPGPVLHVEATAGSFTGPIVVTVATGAASGQCKIETSPLTGKDTLEFNGGDAITEIAYRYLPMPQEMWDALNTEQS